MAENNDNESSGGGVPYLGSRISLISKKEIRYEGILYSINTKEATVALQTVRSFGTEDRVAQGATTNPNGLNVVTPSSSIFDYIIFNGADIKDLHVCEAANNVENLPDDPAIVNSMQGSAAPPAPVAVAPPAPADASYRQSASVSGQQNNNKNSSSSQDRRPAPSTMEHKKNAKTLKPVQQQRRQNNQSNGNANNANRPIPGMGGHLLHVKERGVGEKIPESSTGDFDFERCLGGFDKEKEFSELNLNDSASQSSNAASQTSYQKSSFFDTISCDALDRLEGRDGRVRASDERTLNTETFGASGLNNRFRGRGRGRGRGGYRGRGGGRSDSYHRGRGRGGGRGGNRRQYGDGGLNANAASN